ncbi:MAG: RNA polymerase sigma factor (sigma-70 family) [Patiriisocius sp.]|jgi:RNA polymerase sigma factor (sigma-70 family)
MNQQLEQESILRDCLLGDRSAQKKLFEGNYAKMLGVCLRYATDRDQAKDFVQEGFIKVFAQMGKYNGKGSLEGWIRRIMVNNCIDTIRKDKKNRFISDGENYIESHGSVIEDEQEVHSDIKPEIVIEALKKLSPAYSAVFNLYVVEGYSHKEIAKMLNVSEGTSKSNLAKAKKNLRTYLEKRRDNNYESI